MTELIYLSNLDIDYILTLPEVISAKERIDLRSEGSIYFNISLTPSLREMIYEKFGLNFAQINTIPMRWIKGDTKPHIDRGTNSFDKTYLAYLTDSQGRLLIDGETYPISKGSAYIFSEGLPHETIGTGFDPRLLLGPMNESGISVGGPYNFSYPGGTIIYIRERFEDPNRFYDFSLDQNNWNNFYFPAEVTNTDISLGTLIIEFTTDITFTDFYNYFICASDGIQFGSTSLKNDGTRPIITIEDVNAYPGLIKNGDTYNTGYNNIYVFNLEVRSTGVGNTYLEDDAGWIGQAYFGNQATNNYIINCFSDGDIPENGGGILGNYAGIGDTIISTSSSLFIIGCSSQGNIDTGRGGIVGNNAGSNGGYVKCEQCWSTGSIGLNSGGIFGQYAASAETSIGGEAIANNCYSTGSILSSTAGGIFGQLAGTAATTTAENCYSQGAIYGSGAAADGGTTFAINCYSSGPIATPGSGIYSDGIAPRRTVTNCYVADGNWTNSTANANLTGTPNPVVGNTWVNTGSNLPYELNNMGYTPYTITNIETSPSPALIQSYSESISVGTSSLPAIRSGLSYNILQVSGGNPSSYGTISINNNTGAISTTNSTASGIYTISLRNTGSYNVTTFSLNVSNMPPTITNFYPNGITQTRFPSDPPFNFTLTDPSSNSNGSFSYSSSNTNVANVSGNIVTVYTDGTSNITATQAPSGIYSSGSISTTLLVSNICFLAGTLITTDQGIIAIEKINPDIHTINNKKIVGITKTISTYDFLVCFEKNALGNNIPSQKTYMTHIHQVFCHGKMRKAIECMEFSENVYKVKYRGEVLYNVLMEKYETMEVNNLECETLNPENPIAKLYNLLKKCSPEQQKRIAKEYNEFTIKNNNFSSKQLKHLNKCL